MTPPANNSASFLSVEQVAARYNCSVDSIWRWKRNGDFPAPVRLGAGTTRWRLADLVDYESGLKTCMLVDGTFLVELPAFLTSNDTDQNG